MIINYVKHTVHTLPTTERRRRSVQVRLRTPCEATCSLGEHCYEYLACVAFI
jgi:hypothetical protein